MRLATTVRLVAVVVFCFLSFLLAILGAFLVPYDPVPGLSVGVVIAAVGNYFVAVSGRRATGAAAGAALPAVVWLAVTLTLASGRAEGDVVLSNSVSSLGFIVLGAVAAAVGIGRRAPVEEPREEGLADVGEGAPAPG
ncbi:MAG TPA: DUF6113 family protein [Mycobacteriales bacterium]|nr:DUF6113 family protein [Mycobacteriales bacterium]